MGLSRLSLPLLKLLEFVFALICFVLNFLSKDDASTRLAYSNNETFIVICENGIYLAYMLILFGLLLGFLLGTPINKRIDMFFSLIGGVLFITTGVLLHQFYSKGITTAFATEARSNSLVQAYFSIAGGIIFIIDIPFTFRLSTALN